MARRKRLKDLLVAAILCVAGLTAVLTWRPTAPGVRLGMTRAEVERRLGMPGEEYCVEHDATGAAWWRREYRFAEDLWEVVFVWYNPDQVVVGGCYHREPSRFRSALSRWVAVFGIRYDPWPSWPLGWVVKLSGGRPRTEP
jgi:hypothetical protein